MIFDARFFFSTWLIIYSISSFSLESLENAYLNSFHVFMVRNVLRFEVILEKCLIFLTHTGVPCTLVSASRSRPAIIFTTSIASEMLFIFGEVDLSNMCDPKLLIYFLNNLNMAGRVNYTFFFFFFLKST